MARLEPIGVNAPQIEYWNGPAGERWARLAESQDRMLGRLGLTALEACDIQPGQHVLDSGCGSGATTFEIAKRVGSGGSVTGIDLSGPMLALARTRLAEQPNPSISFENLDVASVRFKPGTFDRVFSRFGVMFFVDPIGAFSNIRSGMKSGAKIAFVCWQSLDGNPWMDIPYRITLQHVSEPPPADPRAPGPMAFAEPDWIQEILKGSGFSKIEVVDTRMKLPLEADARSTAEKLVQLGPTLRLLGNAPPEILAKVADEICEAITPYQTDDGMKIDAATWVVTASSP